MDPDDLEQAIHEPIRLVPYDPDWPARFRHERDRLCSLFPEVLLGVEHYGSTAVPGLSAKPIVDLLVGVSSWHEAKALVPRLCLAGYTVPTEYNAVLTDRQWLMRAADGHRTHHLMVVVHEGAQWRRRLAFRDLLRADADVATGYEQLKVSLAARHPMDREAYTAGKQRFIDEALTGPGWDALPTDRPPARRGSG